ncbi:MAG: GLPGLI family protein [Muribaculum sp.]|nr:GLPGLI family protein [Muribaculum sp.]
MIIKKYINTLVKSLVTSISILIPFFSWGETCHERNLEPALIMVKYEKRMVTDTLARETDFTVSTLTLKAGRNFSAFYDAKLKWIDSLELRNRDYIRSLYKGVEYYTAKGKLHFATLFKDYNRSKLTVLDSFDLTRWEIQEELSKPNWEIGDSTINILGYECILATTDFRGRKWHAWFTPEIPISEGPWKLWGLPGLILKVYDTKKDYEFVALELRSENIGYVEYFNYMVPPIFKTTRMNGLQTKRKALMKDLRSTIAIMGIVDGLKTDTEKPREKSHCNYDFEEIDYPHE